jgi:chromosome segregation protein
MRDAGTHFYRCDLQVHTPRDARWHGARPKSSSERKAYATSFIAACREKGIDAVAITDHHDLTIFPFIKNAAAAEPGPAGVPLQDHERIVVFPGIELTLAVPCQALLLLDANFPEDLLPQVLQALNIDVTPDADTRLSETQVLNHIRNLKQLHEILDQRPWLKHHYIVLPNVTDGGHKTLIRKGMDPEFRNMPCVGGYLDGSIAKLGKGNTDILNGAAITWGRRKVAIFQTSDARRADFSTLGDHTTWVKWAKPTAEALRQACLAQESRIDQLEPHLPNVAISRIVVSNSKFMGPIDLDLNRQYNAIIGGRGTGKSTILGYLRWALCDEPVEADSDTEVANPGARQRRLIEITLTPYAAQVEVHFVINDVSHVVRRASATGDLLLKVGSNEFARARESDIRALLPIHAYSQKQLSSVSIRIEELTRFVTAPIQKHLDDIDRQLGETAGRLRENYATLERARLLSKSVDRSELAVRSVGQQAANLRRSLSGLSSEDRAVLENKPSHDIARQALAGIDTELRRARDLVQTAADQVKRLGVGDQNSSGLLEGPVSGDTADVRQESNVLVAGLATALRIAIADLDAAQREATAYGTKRRSLDEQLRAFDESYAEVKERSTAHEERLKELASLEEQQAAARTLLEQQRSDLMTLGDPSTRHEELRQELLNLTERRSNALADQCEQLTTLSEGLLRARLSRGIGLNDVKTKFRALIAGSNVRGNKVDALFEALRAGSNPIDTWETALTELEQLLLTEPDTEMTTELAPVLSRLGFQPADQSRIIPKLTPDGWLDLALTQVKDYPVFEYQPKEAEYIAFDLASAGQQATALLWVLLAQAGMPLVIDQPEDDLDSQVVLDVVERIWAAKPKRQLIFTSHNANLVVNGDAELVLVCDNRASGDQSGGEIRLQGAIDIPEVREAITRVMEGGERAFRLRQEKYGF